MGIYFEEFNEHLKGEKRYLTEKNCDIINQHFNNRFVPWFGTKNFTWDDSYCLVETNSDSFEYFWAEKGSAEDVKEVDNIYAAIDLVCSNELLNEYSNINPSEVKKYLYDTLGLKKEKPLVKVKK